MAAKLGRLRFRLRFGFWIISRAESITEFAKSFTKLLAVVVVTGACGAASVRDEGLAEFNQGRYSQALPLLQQAARDSSDRTAQVFLGLTEAALNNCKDAAPLLSAQVEGPDAKLDRLAGLGVVKCYKATGDMSGALAIVHRLEKRFPDDADVLYTAAKLHMQAFNDTTLAMFQRTPASYRVHELSAEIFEVQGRYGEAAAEYGKAIEVNGKAPGLHYELGRALLLESHGAEALAKAAEQFEAELALSPEDGACEFQLGQIGQVQGRPDEAKEHFVRALKLSPNFAEAMVALGKIYSQGKDYGQAIPLLVRATQVQPDNEAAHYALLTAYRNSGQMDKAKAEKTVLDRLQKPPEGEFSQFLNKLGEKPPEQ
ncbi:MAG TPA: tetratricopeptide repeat protein [Bryobacteraceae bacterium]|jgi:tetratricopeptide (TPR) repeat protein|nr:tetratricopeptide repeat protein [Bryobacteraceae bacterium]